jgi:hypothetical protein
MSPGGNGAFAAAYKAEELAIIEDQIAVREKAVSVAERNAAAIQSVSMNVKQAQAKTMRQNMGRKQPVLSADQHALTAANDYFNPDDKTSGQHEADEPNFLLPQLDASARSSAVAEKVPEDKRKQNSISVSIPVTGSGSPAIHPQQHNSQKAFHVFNIESARNIVSAVMQMGFTVHDQETFTAVLVEKVRCRHRQPSSRPFYLFGSPVFHAREPHSVVYQVSALLRSADANNKESSSKHFTASYKTSEFDGKNLQRERADVEARERLLAKREQVLLAQAKDLGERSRLIAVAENEAKLSRMKGLIAAEKLGRAHVQEVAAASSKLNLLADDVRGTNDALNALLSGVQALTDLENGNHLKRQIDLLDTDMQQLEQNARDLEIRGNSHTTNILSLESPASPALSKSSAPASSADWRASPFAASLDDEEAALWDRLTIEQLEVLQGLYHTHSKVQHVASGAARAPNRSLRRSACCCSTDDDRSDRTELAAANQLIPPSFRGCVRSPALFSITTSWRGSR